MSLKIEFAGKVHRVRLANADTPETGLPGSVNAAKCPEKMEAGKRAAAFVEAFIGKPIEVQRTKNAPDKYNRVLAKISIEGKDLGELLIFNGLGRFYNGERRMTWCPER
jgi:endonuclease YncB( thermonuclease family)